MRDGHFEKFDVPLPTGNVRIRPNVTVRPLKQRINKDLTMSTKGKSASNK
jgi:hypothetical protein